MRAFELVRKEPYLNFEYEENHSVEAENMNDGTSNSLLPPLQDPAALKNQNLAETDNEPLSDIECAVTLAESQLLPDGEHAAEENQTSQTVLEDVIPTEV